MSALCLPDVTTRPELPGLPLPCLHTASDQRLEVGTFGNAANCDMQCLNCGCGPTRFIVFKPMQFLLPDVIPSVLKI